MGGSSRTKTARRPGARAGRWSSLARFAVAMARGDTSRATRALRASRRAGVTRVAAEETALMLMLYAGYPAALEGLRVLNAVWPGRARARAEGGVTRWRARGERLCRRVYGPVYPRLVARVRALHPDLARWMVEQGYGRVLSRSGLGARERELVTVAVLAASGWEHQLVSHLLGAARIGTPRPQVRSAFSIGAAKAPAAAAVRARRAWRSAFPRAAGGRR